MEVLLGRSYTSLSRPGLYCSHRLKFSSLFCPGSLIKEICLRNLVRHWKSLRKGKKLLAAHAHFFMCHLQPSCAVSIWALLQWQPCLCLDRHPIELDPDHHLQTWFCRFALEPASSQGTCLAIYSWFTLGTVTRTALHPICPYWGMHSLLFK